MCRWCACLWQVALERYQKSKGAKGERLVSGSDDFTMILWETGNDPSQEVVLKARVTGHQQASTYSDTHPQDQSDKAPVDDCL